MAPPAGRCRQGPSIGSSQKLFAIARSTMAGEDAQMELEARENRWPYVLHVQVLLSVRFVARVGLAPLGA